MGDSTVALDIASLRTQPVLNGGTETIETFATNLVAGIGAYFSNVNVSFH